MVLTFIGVTLSTVSAANSLYRKLSGKGRDAEQRMKRLKAARETLLKERNKLTTQKNKADNVADNKAKWKGETRKAYDKRLDDLLTKMENTVKDLDKYCDRLNDLVLEAKKESGNYWFLASDLKTKIQNWVD